MRRRGVLSRRSAQLAPTVSWRPKNHEPDRRGYRAGRVLARAETSYIKVFFVIFLKLSLSLPLLPVVLEVFHAR